MEVSTPSLPPSTKHRVARSCERCAFRKVKCDSLQPACTACTKHNAECKYRILPPRQRRKKLDQSQNLPGRWKQYELPLEQTGDRDAEQESFTASPGLAKTRLLHNETRSKLLENGLWTRVIEELVEPTEALDHSSEDGGDGEEIEDSMDFVLGLTPSSIGIADLHPPADKVLELWDVFKENVDPLTKIVHAPTLEKVVHKASLSLQSLPKSLECMLFAIYSIATLSLKDSDCIKRFDEPQSTLLSRYRIATKAALSRANFIGSTNLAVLQAFIIHLFSVRDVYDSRTIWTLTGLALRIAEGMGLHRDGTVLGLRPFETEIRRRVWWQLRMLDGRSSELSGTDKTRSIDTDPRTPKMPANVNDDELFPGMSSIPESTNRATDMAFCSLRFEVRNLASQALITHGTGAMLWDTPASTESSSDFKVRDKLIKEVERVLQDKYVRYCDPTRPVQLMATIVAQGATSLLSLIAHHPRRWDKQISDAERRYVWDLTLRAIQQWKWVHYSHDLQGFAWNARFYFHWHAFIHILDTLRTDPLIHDATKVWQLIEDVFELAPNYITNTKKALYVAIGSLCLKAYTAREAALAKTGQPIPTTPWYIETLREQRASANLRRKKGGSARSGVEVLGAAATALPKSQAVENSSWQDQMPVHTKGDAGQFPSVITAQQTTANQLQSSANNQDQILSDGPNLSNDVFTFADNDPLTMDFEMFADDEAPLMDFETLLAPDVEMKNSMDQSKSIDWVKWDALLSDFA